MSIFLDEIKKTSVVCHRKHHDRCKNVKDVCECSCHVVAKKNMLLQLEEKLRLACANDKSHVERLS